MTQQFIDFGAFPNDPAADPVRTAFQKIQDNFTDLYNKSAQYGVGNLFVGPGLSTSSQNGDVVLNSFFPNITVQTGSNIVIGVGASATAHIAKISSYTTPFIIDLANTITTGNATIGNIAVTNLAVTNFTSTLIPNSNAFYSIGNSTSAWSDLYLSGNVYLNTVPIESDGGSNIIMPNVIVTNATISNVTSNIVVANTITGNTSIATPNIVLGNITLTTNSSNTLLVPNSLSVTNNVNATVVNVSSNLITPNIVLGNAVITTNASNVVTVSTSLSVVSNINANNIKLLMKNQ